MINPKYFLLALSLAFAAFLISNLVLSVVSAAFLRFILPFAKNWTPRNRAQMIFAARLFPLLVSSIFCAFVLLPAYFLHEPYSTKEAIGFSLGVPAFVSICCISFAFYRWLQTWLATHRLFKNWLAHSEKMEIADSTIPVFRIQHKFPVLAVVGAFRPRIFIAEQIFEMLSEAEIKAAIAHEKGHLVSRDNLKRSLLRVCTDLLVFPFYKRFDRMWAENSEIAADEYAAQNVGKAGAVDLAATIVKVSRLVPLGAKAGLPAGMFFVEKSCGNIDSRVRLLINPDRNENLPLKSASNFNWWFILILLLCFSGTLAFELPIYKNIHLLIEYFMRLF